LATGPDCKSGLYGARGFESRGTHISDFEESAMDTGNARKAAQLGMPYGTATHVLRKALLFRLAQMLGLDECFQCQKVIATVDDFSLEHMVPWGSSEDPKAAFFDLNNIAFSHLGCNARAAFRPKQYPSRREKNEASRKRARADPMRYAKELSDKRIRYAKDVKSRG
jgi:hypothetical protein